MFAPNPYFGRSLDELYHAESSLKHERRDLVKFQKRHATYVEYEWIAAHDGVIAAITTAIDEIDAALALVKEAETESPEARAEQADRCGLAAAVRPRSLRYQAPRL